MGGRLREVQLYQDWAKPKSEASFYIVLIQLEQ